MKPLALVAAALLSAARAGASPDAGFDGGAGLPSPSASGAPASAAPASTPMSDRLWVVVAADDASQRSQAVDAGINLEEVRPGRAGGFATPKAVARARAAGVKVLSQTRLSLPKRVREKGFPGDDSIYHTYAQTVAELQALAAKAPDLASLFSIGKTLQGRDIWALRLCPDAKTFQPSKLPGALFIGEHHAREHLSNEVPLLLAKRLIEGRQDPEVARLLKSRDITIVPMLNADGAEYDIAGDNYRMQRKNMRDNGDGSVGVDLNRNYGFGWGGGGASADGSDETYRGPSAFSEPETQAVKAFVDAKTNLKVLLSYHTYSELVLYPWGHTDAPIDDAPALKAYKTMADELGRMTGYTPEQSSALYIASGDLTDWSWGEHKIFSFTFELMPGSMGGGGFYPGPAAIATSVQLNWRPMLYLLDLADDPGRAGRGAGLTAFSFQPQTTSEIQ